MMTESELCSDTQLVERCLGGDREAFGRIVERYQGLVCALAYNACGDIGRSEDLAQETFLAAWRNLKTLRDGGRLKPWLCGIARHIIQEFHRRATRDPMATSALLEEEVSGAGDSFPPGEEMISKEEQAILWRVLEGLPATYREPLVLFYRQEQSVAEVAETMELSEDAVKQRLSRGREMLSERTAKFVETALHSSGPGKVFTLTVLAALPVLTTSAKAAVIGAAAAKGSATANVAAGVGLLNAVLGPLLGLFGSWIGYRMSLDSAKSEREREFVRMFYRRVLVLVAVFTVLLTSLILWGAKSARAHPNLFAGAIISVIVGYVAVLLGMIVWSRRKFREFWADQAKIAGDVRVPVREYRSKTTLLGLPLVHIRLNERLGKEGPVKAWIAAGDRAYGLLLAFGGVAVAPISCGGLAIGLVPWGGCAFGLFAVGGLAIGGWAFGGLAVGWLAFGGCAMGWHAAMGGLAVARDFALGGFAQAAQANNQIAAQFIKTNWFFQNMQIVARHIGWLHLLWIVPLVLWWRALPLPKMAP